MRPGLAVVSLSSLLVACGGGSTTPPPPPAGTITGKVFAPLQGSIKDALVLACFLVGDGCDDAKSDGVVIQQDGASATYTISNLADGDYAVIAAQAQLDANGNLVSLDSVGVYLKGDSQGQQYTRVRPPVSGIDISLTSTANPDSTSMPVNAGPGTSVPQELQGEFYSGSPSPVDYYNPSTGSWAQPSGNFTSYTFKADGTLEYGGLLQSSLYSCTSSFFSIRSGTVQVSGDQLTMNFLDGRLKYTSSCDPSRNYERATTTGADVYTWRVAPDDQDPSLIFLHLTDGQGQQRSFLKRK